MFDWLRRSSKNQTMPEYSGARGIPSRGVPSRRAEQEANEAFSARCDSIQRWLCESPRRPGAESPLFVEILSGNTQSVVTIERTNDTHCMPVFSSPFRAADYVRTLLASDPPVAYLSSSPLELLAMFRDLRQVKIEEFTLDRCPRCEAFCAIPTASMTTTDDVINCWSIFKAMELARLEQFLSYAQAAARAQQFYTARDVLLEAAAHVSVEDPRLHFSLGQIARALYDSELLHEAKAFLRFFKLKSWERRLDHIAPSRWSDYDYDFLVEDSGLSAPHQ
jgi:hypothetical protein